MAINPIKEHIRVHNWSRQNKHTPVLAFYISTYQANDKPTCWSIFWAHNQLALLYDQIQGYTYPHKVVYRFFDNLSSSSHSIPKHSDTISHGIEHLIFKFLRASAYVKNLTQLLRIIINILQYNMIHKEIDVCLITILLFNISYYTVMYLIICDKYFMMCNTSQYIGSTSKWI